MHRELMETGGRILLNLGLVDAFGHLSVRNQDNARADTYTITPPVPLGSLAEAPGGWPRVSLEADALPKGAPREAWIHSGIYHLRPDVGAICRAQPPSPMTAVAAGIDIQPLHGQGAMIGGVAVFPDSRLARDRPAGVQVGQTLADSQAIVLKGNGAVTVGADLPEAVMRMVLLEQSATLNLRASAASAGPLLPLPDIEQDAWRVVSRELLRRMWDHYAAQR